MKLLFLAILILFGSGCGHSVELSPLKVYNGIPPEFAVFIDGGVRCYYIYYMESKRSLSCVYVGDKK